MEDTPSAVFRASRLRQALFIFFGIILPLAAIGLKEMAADIFFDPAPTALHWALLLLVPLFHVAMLLVPPAVFQKSGLAVVAGICLGVSTAYTIAFSPILPIAAVFTVVGIGLLPFAPLGALVSTAFSLRRIAAEARNSDAGQQKFYQRTAWRACAGAIMGLTLLVTPSVQDWIALRKMRQAASPVKKVSTQAIFDLRNWASQRAMLEAGLNTSKNQNFFYIESILGERIPHDEAAAIYYRVSGETVAEGAVRHGLSNNEEDRWWNDPWLGGTQIGEIDQHTELIASRLDASIDGDAVLGYSEWTLEFKNTHAFQSKEARARITLPHGGVVSRVTLWVNGEPQEAAFGGASQVRSAYEAVVKTQRDPLLVTQTGPDEVGIQCFPILPNGGTMKIRIGMTYPLELVNPERARFTLPTFLARNFTLPESTGHSVWIESDDVMKTARFGSSRGQDGQQVLGFDEGELLEEGAPISVEVERKAVPFTWTYDNSHAKNDSPANDISAPAEEKVRIIQAFEPSSQSVPTRISLVVDTSRSMEDSLEAVATLLESPVAAKFPEIRVALPNDLDFTWTPSSKEKPREHIAEQLREIDTEGGIDNVPAVVAAMRWAAQSEHGIVLWLHGPQPVTLSDPTGIIQALERSSVRLFHTQIGPGEHAALTRMGPHAQLLTMPRYGQLQVDLADFFSHLSGKTHLQATRTRLVHLSDDEPLVKGVQTSDHLARLWAADEVQHLASAHYDDAVALATRYRLVTPVSGAVVLETAAQYAEAGLDPGGTATVGSPSVPEPETWALIFLCIGLAFWQLKKRELAA